MFNVEHDLTNALLLVCKLIQIAPKLASALTRARAKEVKNRLTSLARAGLSPTELCLDNMITSTKR